MEPYIEVQVSCTSFRKLTGQKSFKELPAFSPFISVEALPTIALVALLAAFSLTFFLTT